MRAHMCGCGVRLRAGGSLFVNDCGRKVGAKYGNCKAEARSGSGLTLEPDCSAPHTHCALLQPPAPRSETPTYNGFWRSTSSSRSSSSSGRRQGRQGRAPPHPRRGQARQAAGRGRGGSRGQRPPRPPLGRTAGSGRVRAGPVLVQVPEPQAVTVAVTPAQRTKTVLVMEAGVWATAAAARLAPRRLRAGRGRSTRRTTCEVWRGRTSSSRRGWPGGPTSVRGRVGVGAWREREGVG